MTNRATRRTPVLLATALTLLAGTLVAAPAQAQDQAQDGGDHDGAGELSWRDTPTGSTERFRGLAPVSRDVAWVSGTGGTVLRTTDGGSTWQDVSPGTVDGADTSGLQLRDIEAWDAQHAVALSIGEGTDSRILRTEDGGRTWHAGFVNQDPKAFYDCLAFFDARHGLAMSDPVDGRFRVVSTDDGGRSWSVVDPAGMPPALDGEFGFAASGTCLVTSGGHDAWMATGGGERARVLHSRDRGRTWTASDTPVRSTAAGGIFSLAFRDPRHGVAVGGDFTAPDEAVDAAARSQDGGSTWALSGSPLGGYRSGSAWLPRTDAGVVAVGPSGSDVSWDAGRTWTTFSTGSLDSVECTGDGACWASGANGRVARLVTQH